MESEKKDTPYTGIGVNPAHRLVQDFFQEIDCGNIGAAAFVKEAFTQEPEFWRKATVGFRRMQQFNIVGEKLYLLWNDCCGRNTSKAVNVMLVKSIEDIFAHLDYEHGRGIPFEDDDYE